MGRINYFLLGILCVVFSGPIVGQGLGLATLKSAFFQQNKFSVVSSNVFLYRRSLSQTGSISHLKLGSPSLGIGTASPSATLEINSPIKIRRNIMYAPRVFTSSMGSGSILNISLVTTNVVVITMNFTAAGPVSLNVLLNLTSPSSITGPMILLLKTTSVTRPTRLGIVYSDVNAITGYNKIKWPSGDSPVFSKTKDFCDIVYLYWTGPNWTADDPSGTMFGMAMTGIIIN